MTRALIVLILALPGLQDDKVAPLAKDLESTDLRRVYHGVADLAALGDAALPAVDALAKDAKGRVRDYLNLAADEIRASGSAPSPARRFSMKAADRNVVELLNELRTKTGVALSLENLQGEEKLPDAAVDIHDATMLEAFDAICHAGNVAVTMENGQFMLYQGDYQDVPRFFYSHYFFRLSNYVLMKTATFRKPAVQSFKIQMEMLWDPAAAPCRFNPPVLLEAVDDHGKTLILPPPPKKKDLKAPPDPVDDNDQESAAYLELVPPTPGALKIAVLRGYVPVSLPKTRATVSFSEPARNEGAPEDAHAGLEGLVRKTGDFTLKISKVEAGMFRIGVEISSTKLKPEDLAKLPVLAGVWLKGGDIGRTYVSLWSMKEDVAELMISFQPLHLKEPLIRLADDRPAPPPVIEKLELSIVTSVQERRIPFEFRDLKIK